MKQIDFNQPGGFPLEQETLKRLQTAYRSELYEAFKEHLGITTDKNYIISYPAGVGQNGWAVIHQNLPDLEDPLNGNSVKAILYPIKYKNPSTNFLKTTRKESSLLFGSGFPKNVYVDYEAEFVSESSIPGNYFTSGSNPIIADKIIQYYYNLSTFKVLDTVAALSEKFLPINGSKPMEGDLKLGGHKLSNLDTNPAFSADVRSQDFKLGHPDRRGQLHPGDYLGRALVDYSDEVRTNLYLNFDKDWENTIIRGKVSLPDVDVNSSQATPLLIDDQGNILKSSGNFETNVPLGLIALWNGNSGPIPNGWTRCDGATSSAGAIQIPNLGAFDMDPDSDGSKNVFYIIYTGVSNVGISLGADRVVNLAAGQTESGTITLTASVSPSETDTTDYVYSWKRVFPNDSNAVPVNLPETSSVLTLTGLVPDSYTYKVTATTPSGLTIFDEVKVLIKSANNAPVINQIFKASEISSPVDIATGLNLGFSVGSASLDLVANVTDPDGNQAGMTYQWIKLSGPVDGAVVSPTIRNTSATSVNVNLTATGLKETTAGNPYVFKFTAIDIQGVAVERIVTVTVTQTASLQIIAPNPIPVPPGVNVTYTVRVTGRPNTQIPLRATIGQFNEYGFGNSTGSMKVKESPNFYATVYTTVSVSDYDTLNSESTFMLNLGETGVKDLTCQVISRVSNLSTTPYEFGFEYADGSYYIENWVTAALSIDTTDIAVEMHAFDSNTFFVENSGGSGSCFDVESPVLMASGQSKKLKNIVIGDKLQGMYFPNEVDESKGNYFDWTGKLSEGVKAEVTVVNKRTAVVPNYYEFTLLDGAVIKVTAEHPLLVTKDGEQVQWLKVANVTESMSLIDKNGNLKAIQSIVFKQETLQIATIDVENVDNYVIAGIVAHNKIDPYNP